MQKKKKEKKQFYSELFLMFLLSKNLTLISNSHCYVGFYLSFFFFFFSFFPGFGRRSLDREYYDDLENGGWFSYDIC